MDDINLTQEIDELATKANQLRENLTPNQTLFCSEYLKDRNATRSYLVVYPCCKSENAAAVNGLKLLRNAKIKSYLEKELEIVRLRNSIATDNILREEACICFSDIRKLFDYEGKLIPLDQLPEDVSKAVAYYEIKTRPVKLDGDEWGTATTFKVRFWDKGAALGRMERHLGMYVNKQELTVPGGRAIEVKSISKNEIARRIAFMFQDQLRKMEKKLPK
jgi:phage terminase small subunit